MEKNIDTDRVKNFDKFSNKNDEVIVNKAESFKRELKELLAKYDADIYANLDGDTHGVSVDIVIDISNKEVIRSRDEVTQYNIK